MILRNEQSDSKNSRNRSVSGLSAMAEECLLGFHLEEGTTFEDAVRIADLMNNKITALTLRPPRQIREV